MFKKKPTSKKIVRRNDELLTDSRGIARLLEQLSRRYTPLTVQIAGHEALFTSCSVGIEGAYLMLDELLPSVGHKWLLEEGEIKVTGKLDGIDINFKASLAHVDEQDNVVTYYMHLPEQLEYKQRRSAYRVHIPMSKQMRVVLDDGDGTTVDSAGEFDDLTEGVLHDLSQGGAGLILVDTETTVQTGVVKECAIELPDEWLYVSVEFRYTKNVGVLKRQLIGVNFTGLRPAQTRLIGRFISELERELMRKRAMY